MNEVCRLTAIRMQNQTGSNPNSIMMGASTGTWIKVISIKSRKKPITKISPMTMARDHIVAVFMGQGAEKFPYQTVAAQASENQSEKRGAHTG